MQIRTVEDKDVEALYAIALATGAGGEDAAHLYADPRMIGHIYAVPYARLAPDLALVLEDENGVAGYVVGAVHTPAWEARLEQAWWPSLRPHYADPKDVAPALQTEDQRRASMIHHPSRTPVWITDAYPSHAHLNLLPHARQRGAATQLFHAWLDVAGRHGATAIHVGVNRGNERGLRFWEKQGFRPLIQDGSADARTVWMGRDADRAGG